MNHLFLFVPKTFIDWLFLIAGFAFVVFQYVRKMEPVLRTNVKSVGRFWRFLFLGAIPLLGIFIEIIFLNTRAFRSTAYDSSILIRLIAISFPVIYSINYLPFKKGYFWTVGWGLVYSLVVTHSPFTVLEFSILYLVILGGYHECSRQDPHGFFVRIINVLLRLTPYLFLVSFIQYPGSIAVRLDVTFIVGWFRIFGYWFSTILASLVFCGLSYIFSRSPKPELETESQDKSISDHISYRIIIYFVIVLFLILSSGVWLIQRNSFTDKLNDATDEIIDSFATDYFYFFDMGKALIQSHAKEYESLDPSQYATRIIEQINRIPFFSSLMVYEKDVLKASYPTVDPTLLFDENICLGLTKTDTLLRTQKEGDNTYFQFSSGSADGICLVGITTLEFSPQLNQYVKLMDQFSTYWSITDESGDQYSSGEKEWEGAPAFYTSGFYKVVEYSDGPMILTFVQVYRLDAIASTVFQRTALMLLSLLLMHLILLMALVILNRSFKEKINDTMQDLDYLKNFEFDALLKGKSANTWIGLSHQLRDIAIAIQSETSYLQKGLEVVDKINDVSTYQELQRIITKEKFLQDIGKLSLLIDPNLNMVGLSPGDGQFISQYNAFLRMAEEKSFRPFSIKSAQKKNDDTDVFSTLFPLRHEEQLVGFLIVLHFENRKIHNHQIRFLESLSNMIAGAILHRLQRTQANIEVERINFLVQSFPEPIIVLDRGLNLVVINEAAKQLPGIVGELASYGQPINRFVHDHTLLGVLNAADKAGNVSTRAQLANHHEYLITVVAGGAELSSDKGWSLVAMQDITQFKEQGRVRAELFETVAQYLQMPIKMTRGNLRMLSMVGSLNESQRNYADNMEANIDDIDNFVKQMMERNRLENPANYDIKIVNLDEILKEVVDRIIPYTQQQNVAIYLERDSDLKSRQIEIDPQLFSQAIFSLLENAVQNNHVGGEVEITIDNQSDHFVVCIADNGPGISAVDLNRIFVDPSVLELHGESPRISMGVQLAKSIIERHNGEIWVKSKLGKGSQFFVKIPRYLPSFQRNGSL